MSLIYQPAGRAREYSPFALNIYKGCDHGCKYNGKSCYIDGVLRRPGANNEPEQRSGFLETLSKELSKSAPRKQVLLSFIGDPYCHMDVMTQTTRGTLQLLFKHKVPTAILTKGGERALRDIDIMKEMGRLFKFGSTLCFVDDDMRKLWEPLASRCAERLDVLKIMHDAGIRTWASIEPVIDPAESLAVIAASLPFVDQYKVGKLNHNKEIERSINWAEFLKDAVTILRKAGKPFYIKKDLQVFDLEGVLTAEEKNMERFELVA